MDRPTVRAYGRLQVSTQASADGACGGLGADPQVGGDVLHQAAITAATVTRPDVFVICYGGNVLAQRDRDGVRN